MRKRITQSSVARLHPAEQASLFFQENTGAGLTLDRDGGVRQRHRYPNNGPTLIAQAAFHNDWQAAMARWKDTLPR